jgi:hypothetical protein
MKSIFKRMVSLSLAALIVALCLELAGHFVAPGRLSVIPAAEAVVGRPLTPVSVAGVARRTTRRCAAGVYNC